MSTRTSYTSNVWSGLKNTRWLLFKLFYSLMDGMWLWSSECFFWMANMSQKGCEIEMLLYMGGTLPAAIRQTYDGSRNKAKYTRHGQSEVSPLLPIHEDFSFRDRFILIKATYMKCVENIHSVILLHISTYYQFTYFLQYHMSSCPNLQS